MDTAGGLFASKNSNENSGVCQPEKREFLSSADSLRDIVYPALILFNFAKFSIFATTL